MEPEELIRWADQVEQQHQEWLQWMQEELDRDAQRLAELAA